MAPLTPQSNRGAALALGTRHSFPGALLGATLAACIVSIAVAAGVLSIAVAVGTAAGELTAGPRLLGLASVAALSLTAAWGLVVPHSLLSRGAAWWLVGLLAATTAALLGVSIAVGHGPGAIVPVAAAAAVATWMATRGGGRNRRRPSEMVAAQQDAGSPAQPAIAQPATAESAPAGHSVATGSPADSNIRFHPQPAEPAARVDRAHGEPAVACGGETGTPLDGESGAETDIEAGVKPESLLDPACLYHVQRWAEGGDQRVVALMRCSFESGQGHAALHLPIVPPLDAAGEAHVLQVGGEPVECTVGMCEPFGVRIDLRRRQRRQQPAEVLVEIVVQSAG